MSVKLTHDEIKRFLSSPESEVLVIKGKWGVGKTYTWRHYLEESANKKQLSKKDYSYVSLFGVNNLNDVKYMIVESTVPENEIKQGPSITSFNNAISFISKNSFFQTYAGGSEKIIFSRIRNQIVCIDDIERRSSNFDIMDILGLISFLKEQRDCKVVLLLNDDELDSKEKFNKQLEKIADVVMDFSPTATESAEIVFPKHDKGIEKMLYENCIKLGIVNIRVVKKIERYAKRLNDILKKKYTDLIPQAIHSTALYTWMLNQPDEAPPINFITDASVIFGLTDKKLSDKEKNWQAIIRNYGYIQTDDFDNILFENLSRYINEDTLLAVAEKQKQVFNQSSNEKNISKAWEFYHNSFDDNEVQVLDEIYKTTKKSIKYVTVSNLNSTVLFLKEFKRVAEAKELIKLFVETHSTDKEIFDLSRSVFNREIDDKDIKKSFKDKLNTLRTEIKPQDILEKISTKRGWNPEDIQILNSLKIIDFYKLFKNAKGEKKHHYIDGALMLRGSLDNPESVSVAKKATEALIKIAKENKMNERRVSSYGIILPKKKS